MHSFSKKISLPIAVKQRNLFNLSKDHYTTNDFFRVKPIYLHETVPGEEITINLQSFSRTVALAKPFYGKVDFVNRAFWVPCRSIMNEFNEFIEDTATAYQSSIPHVPTIANNVLVNMFTNQSWKNPLTIENDIQTQGANDFSTSTHHYQFTLYGKLVYDILRNLGYHINFSITDNTTLSALPIIAFAKMYKDWLMNSNYLPIADFQTKFDGETVLSATQIYNLLTPCLFAMYEKDYFTTAWPSPVSPGALQGVSSVNIPDASNDLASSNNRGSLVRSKPQADGYYPSTPSIIGGSPDGISSGTTPSNLTQYALDTLKKLTDYVKRHQLVGARALDRFAASFGIELPDAKLDRTTYLGSSIMTMDVGEVMCTADNAETDTAVGDYAGRSAGYGKGSFHFKSDEFGYIIIVSIVRPHTGYFQGRSRLLQHINRLDFFTPEFDKLGVQPIRQDEFFADYFDITSAGTYNPSQAFGFTGRYAEYKTSLDDVSGDFVLESRNEGLDCFHLMRTFPDGQQKISQSFTYGVDGEQFDRVFINQESDTDHFITVYHFDIKASLPMSKLFEDYDFDGGRLINKEIGGTSLE